jgi:hypothetical protein
MAQAVECLPMWEALDLISSTKKKKKKKKGAYREAKLKSVVNIHMRYA